MGPLRSRGNTIFLDAYPKFLHAELLEYLLAVRESRKRPFDNGLYHDEMYPFGDCAYEKQLLEKRYFSEKEKLLGEETEDLLVEIGVIQSE